jgi:hypothetical protein
MKAQSPERMVYNNTFKVDVFKEWSVDVSVEALKIDE